MPAGRSVSAMLTSDDRDVRAYVATLGWLRYVVLEAARGDPSANFTPKIRLGDRL